MKKETDPRVTKKHFTWKMFLYSFLVLQVLNTGQILIYDAYVPIEQVPSEFIFGIIGYWALVTLAFCLLTRKQMIKAYDKPTRILSEAAKQVAEGDFSISIEPRHKKGKMDYIDVMYEDFNKMVEELDSNETLKSDFIANVSHEIKTPLAIIQNYATVLQKENISEELRKEYSSTIITATKNLTMLVTNILKLNKLENQEIIPVTESYDLCRQLCECALAFEDLWEQKNIELKVEMDDRVMIRSDQSMLEIVWNNLLSNALKFTEPGGEVLLNQISDEEFITVSITDNGCGMDKETMKRIFDKFYQGDTSRSIEGNGLGLALSLRVIELVGGEISVTSEVGRGTTFTVTLKAET